MSTGSKPDEEQENARTRKLGKKISELQEKLKVTEEKNARLASGTVHLNGLIEKAPDENKEKLSGFLRLLPEVIFEATTSGRLTFVNLKAFDIFGYTEKEFRKGLYILDMVVPEDREKAAARFQKVLEGVDFKGSEYTVQTKTGERIPVLVYSSRMICNGELIGVRGVMVDISRRKESELKERKHQENLVFLNRTALDFLGQSADTDVFRYIGEKLNDLVENVIVMVARYGEESSELRAEYISGIDQNIKSVAGILGCSLFQLRIRVSPELQKTIGDYADRLYLFTGGLREVTDGQLPLSVCKALEKLTGLKKMYGMGLLRGGKLYGTVLLAHRKDSKMAAPRLIETFVYQASIALHRRQLENELIKAKVRAEESDRLKTAFLANMSHEIRTPMSGILGLTQLLEANDLKKSTRNEYLQMIRQNGDLLMKLVNDIIDIAKIESNQINLQRRNFKLNDLLGDIYRFFMSDRRLINNKDLKLSVDCPLPDDESSICADPLRLHQILNNLIGNALKFTEMGRIQFGYRLKGSRTLEFYVSDTGKGIDPDKLPVIFDRFTQADCSLTREYGGAGLGLAISRGLVEHMGGNISAKSRPGKGSEFAFTIGFVAADQLTGSGK